jgi:molecular chaperone GrpE (heat shock protein)
MNMQKTGILKRLWGALMGRNAPPTEVPSPRVEPGPPDEERAQLLARVASLEMELRERDRRIEQMRAEYATLQAAKARAGAEAGQDQLEKLFKRLAGTLGNLNVLTAMAEAGREVDTGDLIQLIKGLEKEFGRAGLEPIGAVGEKTLFAVASHQRMSGGAVHDSVPVIVQVPGYRLGAKILIKALVSAREDEPRQEQDNGPDRD